MQKHHFIFLLFLFPKDPSPLHPTIALGLLFEIHRFFPHLPYLYKVLSFSFFFTCKLHFVYYLYFVFKEVKLFYYFTLPICCLFDVTMALISLLDTWMCGCNYVSFCFLLTKLFSLGINSVHHSTLLCFLGHF